MADGEEGVQRMGLCYHLLPRFSSTLAMCAEAIVGQVNTGLVNQDDENPAPRHILPSDTNLLDTGNKTGHNPHLTRDPDGNGGKFERADFSAFRVRKVAAANARRAAKHDHKLLIRGSCCSSLPIPLE